MPAAEGHAEQDKLVEHCWVMTRNEGWVTFWETLSGKMYHLPRRYTEKKPEEPTEGKKKKRKKDGDEAEPEAIDDMEERPPELLWEGEAQDSKVGLEDMEALPTPRRQPKAKAKVAAG